MPALSPAGKLRNFCVPWARNSRPLMILSRLRARGSALVSRSCSMANSFPLRGQADGFAERRTNRDITLLGADGEPVGGDEFGVDADEVEHAAQIGFKMLERGGRRARAVDSAA